MLTRDGYCKRESKMKIARKISLLTSNSGRNWLGVMFEALLYMAQRPGH
jgi:hypothetical protein